MNSVLYCQGTFSVANPDSAQTQAMKAAASDIAAAGFDCVILGQWHVHAAGDIYYNDSLLSDVETTLAWLPAALKEGGVKNVLVSFGPFGSDFQHIIDPANLGTFKATMAQLLQSCAIDGIDWDLEQDLTAQNVPALVDLVDWATSNGFMTTADPYYAQSDFWNPVQKQSAAPGFAWWNVQMYSSGENIDEYGQWVEGASGLVADPSSFIVPGYNVDASNGDPGSITSMLQADQGSQGGPDGAMLWKYEFIVSGDYSPGAYVQAIAAGIAPSA